MVDEQLIRELQEPTAGAGGAWLDASVSAAAAGLLRYPGRRVPEVVHSADDAAAAASALGFPVVLKAGAADLVHKSDVGGVALDLRDAAARARRVCTRWKPASATA